MIKHIPNILTMLRVVLVPFFIYYTTKNEMEIAFIIFITASITDYFDGYLARRFKVISNFGKIMDPLADKLLVLSATYLLCFGEYGILSPWIFYIIAFRELLITILRELFKRKKIILAANNWGKVKTVTQMVGLTAIYLILALNLHLEQFPTGANIYFWGVAVITILSGMSYLKGIKELF